MMDKSCIAHTVIIILLLFIIWKIYYIEKATDQVYTSGADLRRIGQVFTSTDQGEDSEYHGPLIMVPPKR